MRKTTDRILSAIEKTAMAIALTCLALIMFSITADAFGRYFLNAPVRGQYEFTSLYLMVIFTFMGLSRTQALGGHISITVLATLLAGVPWQLPARIAALIAAGAWGLVAVLTGEEALARIAARTTTFGAVQFPTYLSYCWVPLGTGILALRLLHQTIWPIYDGTEVQDYE